MYDEGVHFHNIRLSRAKLNQAIFSNETRKATGCSVQYSNNRIIEYGREPVQEKPYTSVNTKKITWQMDEGPQHTGWICCRGVRREERREDCEDRLKYE